MAQLTQCSTDLAASLTLERKAWAALQAHANNAHLAAVMGPSLRNNTRPSGGWKLDEGIHQDTKLRQLLAKVKPSVRSQLESAIADHLRWNLQQVEDGITADISAVAPTFDLADDDAVSREGNGPRTDHSTAVADTDLRMVDLDKVAAAQSGKNPLHSSRIAVQTAHTEQTAAARHDEL